MNSIDRELILSDIKLYRMTLETAPVVMRNVKDWEDPKWQEYLANLQVIRGKLQAAIEKLSTSSSAESAVQ